MQLPVVQRRRHDQQFQIVTQPLLHVQQQGQRQIRLQTTLMKFIKDHQLDAVQLGIALDHSCQHPFRHHFKPRLRANAALRAHPITDRFAGLLVQEFRQPLRHIACRQAARLQQDNSPLNAFMRQKLQRQPGRFPRAGWGGEQNLGRAFKRGK